MTNDYHLSPTPFLSLFYRAQSVKKRGMMSGVFTDGNESGELVIGRLLIRHIFECGIKIASFTKATMVVNVEVNHGGKKK